MVATKGYTIKQLSEEKAELQNEVNIWNMKLARLQSLENMQASFKVKQMLTYTEMPRFVNGDSQLAAVDNTYN